ncbi:MAG: glycine betaine ABC transporter substrate-binding protein [Gemmataceae bacterium]
MFKLRYLYLLLFAVPGCGGRDRAAVQVGSKAFTESVILGELVKHLCTAAGAEGEHHRSLGDTSKTWEGLLAGELDVYVEYTGTLTQEVLSRERPRTAEELSDALARRGLRMSRSLGFRNNNALGMREKQAGELGVRTVSDLAKHPTLRLGLSHAFIERGDGWRGLKRRYQLPFATPPGMEHALAYQGLTNGSLDVIDLYTTDAKILEYGVRVLEDDRGYFPSYEAVLLYRADLEEKSPRALASILRMQGAIDERGMQQMNLRAERDRVPEAVVAADYLGDRLGVHVEANPETLAQRLWRTTRQHLRLVAISLALAILTAVPLGVLAARHPLLEQAHPRRGRGRADVPALAAR